MRFHVDGFGLNRRESNSTICKIDRSETNETRHISVEISPSKKTASRGYCHCPMGYSEKTYFPFNFLGDMKLKSGKIRVLTYQM